MVRRLIAGVVLAGTAACSVAGCGTDAKKDHAGPEVAWAGKICTTMAQTSALSVPKLNSADVLKDKKSLAKLLDGIAKRMATLEMNLQGVGAPPVPNGKQLFTTAMGNLTRTHSSVSTASKRLQKAKVTDKKSLQTAVKQVGTVFAQYNTYQGPQQDFRKDPKLNAAFTKAPACKTAKPS